MSFLPKVGRIDRSKEVPPIRLLMYAPAGFGKTYFASKWPDPIILNTDGNIVHTDLPGFVINEWETPPNYVPPTQKEIDEGAVDLRQHAFLDVVEELIAQNGAGFKTIIVDLIESVYQIGRTSKLKEFGLTHESDLPNGGKGYAIVRTPFYAAIDRLMSLPINVVILSHEKEKIVKDRIGREFSFFQPNLDDAVLKKMSGHGYTLRGYMKPLAVDGNDSPKVVRMLSLSPKADEFQVTRFIDAAGNPIVLEDIELTYQNFHDVMKNIKDPEKVGEFKFTNKIEKVQTGREKIAGTKKVLPKESVKKEIPKAEPVVEKDPTPVKADPVVEAKPDPVVKPEPVVEKTVKTTPEVKEETTVTPEVVKTPEKTVETNTTTVADTKTTTPTPSISPDRAKRLAQLKKEYLTNDKN